MGGDAQKIIKTEGKFNKEFEKRSYKLKFQ